MRFITLTLALLAAAQNPAPGRLTLDIVAVDRVGAPVVDLRPEELEVWISGYRVPVDDVAFITPEAAPRTVVLLLDNVAVGPELAIRVREAARAFVKHLGERDRVSLGPVEGPRIDGTGEPARLLQAIDKYYPQGFPLRIEDAGDRLNLNAVLRFDESGAPNQQTAPLLDALLAKVIDEIPLPPASKLYERDRLVGKLIDYVDPDEVDAVGGSENEAFERGQTTVRNANRPLLSVDELRLVEGFDATLVEALRPYVTVYPYVGVEGVNPNTAPPHVLALLFFNDGVDLRMASEDTVRELLAVRQEGRVVCGEGQSGEACTPIREIVENAIFPPPAFQSSVFVVTAEARVGSVRRSIEAVLDRAQGAQPLLLSWRVL